MKILSVGNFGTGVKVDNELFEYLNQWKWTYDATNGYVHRNQYSNGKKKKIYMHRLIMDEPKGLQIDHINGDRLDNRCDNLRICTPNQNRANRLARGVYWHKAAQKWCIQISFNNKRYYVGLYEDKNEADRVYEQSVRTIKGEFAR